MNRTPLVITFIHTSRTLKPCMLFSLVHSALLSTQNQRTEPRLRPHSSIQNYKALHVVFSCAFCSVQHPKATNRTLVFIPIHPSRTKALHVVFSCAFWSVEHPKATNRTLVFIPIHPSRTKPCMLFYLLWSVEHPKETNRTLVFIPVHPSRTKPCMLFFLLWSVEHPKETNRTPVFIPIHPSRADHSQFLYRPRPPGVHQRALSVVAPQTNERAIKRVCASFGSTEFVLSVEREREKDREEMKLCFDL